MNWISCLVAGVLLTISAACAQESTLRNPLDRECKDELVRLKTPVPAGTLTVLDEGRPVPFQVEGRSIWVCSTFAPQSVRRYVVQPGAVVSAAPRVNVQRTGAHYELDNGVMAVRVPAEGVGGPIAGVKVAGKWVGESFWKTKPVRLTSTILGDGALYGKVRLHYEFAPGWSEVDVTVGPGWRHAVIEERHEMGRGEYYEVVLNQGWSPTQGLSLPFSGGFFAAGVTPSPHRELKPGGQPFQSEELYINLFPRWNQHCKDGWFFAATDGENAVGALVTRASRWFWPHDNAIQAVVKPTGDYAGLRCPTWHGARLWFLMAGPKSAMTGDGKNNPLVDYVNRYALESLDKLNHELIIEWPGKEGKFAGFFPYSSGINPTGPIRGMGRNAIANAGKSGNYSTLTQAQMMLHPDCYGSYYLYWSPENPNFFSDYIKPPIAMICQLKEHPQFKELAALAEAKLREDVDHSITLPGGAGQECPGYQGHGSGQWGALAAVCREHLGFDLLKWERVKASDDFLDRISQPDGAGKRRMLPMGDTHPAGDGPKVVGAVANKNWETVELPGFGVIFQNLAGTDKETFLAFKSGPNRGHYHGDQLAFHYCADAKPVAVDHHCSYKPRAGQEHMHNRVAFSTDKFPYANMDGYERLIAFKTSANADIAVGQVESDRLRSVKSLPPEDWHAEYPQLALSKPLAYRRTIVFVKGGAKDYFVMRDQFDGGDELNATYCLHVRSDKAERKGQTVEFGNLTLYCAKPASFDFERFDWKHDNGGGESTSGARLTIKGRSGEFITVLYPGKATFTATPNGVKVGNDEVTFTGDEVSLNGKTLLTGTDINLTRSQGQIGLFVPDAGYPFGTIPDWLIKQRAASDLETARRLSWPIQP
jgi:hypothetical protein